MLETFLASRRSTILTRTRRKIERRRAPRPTEDELTNGVPLFVDHLFEALRLSEQDSEGSAANAALRGAYILRTGFTIGQIVRDYGDICEAIVEVARESDRELGHADRLRLNRCLDEAVAAAVKEWTRLRTHSEAAVETERLGQLAHELRNKLGAATLAFQALKEGHLDLGGSTGQVLERNLRGLRELIDRSLLEVRIESGVHRAHRISVCEIIEEIELDASLEANALQVELSVATVPRDLEILGDRPILAAAVINLLQNAFKFTRHHGHVALTTSANTERVIFEVEDECGGLPLGKAEELFRPYTQRSENREGLGLGLSISRRGIEASGGELDVRDLPGKGCVFRISMPRA